MRPSIWRTIPGGWSYVLRIFARRPEDDVDAELRFHFDERAAELMAQGLSRQPAREQALEEFGDVESVRTRLRDIGRRTVLRKQRADWWESAAQDLKYALRGLQRSPGFTVAVIATLGLGIGANAAMFSIVDRLLFRPPPMLRDPALTHRIYLAATNRGHEFMANQTQFRCYLDFRDWTSSFARFAQVTTITPAVGSGADSQEMQVAPVSASFFDFFDAPPALGRYFTPVEDSIPNGTPVAVLGYGYWQTRFGGRRDAVGATVRIGPLVYTVIGVSPAGFAGLWPDQPPVAYIPISSYASTQDPQFFGKQWWHNYNIFWSQTIALRKPGVSVAAANVDLSNAYARSWKVDVAEHNESTPVAIAKPRAFAASILAQRGPNQGNLSKVVVWVGGVTLIVLLIACANVANLLLARALNRRREIAVRIALGVSRRRLLSQLLTESVLLASLGGLAGFVIAETGGALLRAAFIPNSVAASLVSDHRTVLFAFGAALTAGVLTGLAPAWQLRTVDLTSDLKSGAREGTYLRSKVRIGLIILQGALSLLLLVGAGLFVRSLGNARSARLGYDVNPVLVVKLNMRGVVVDSAHKVQLLERLLVAAKALPAVEHASRMVSVPLGSSRGTDLFVEGIDSVDKLGHFDLNAVSPEYFATLGTRIVRGRGISEQDRAGAPRAMVVSASMARRIWPSRDAIGQCIRMRADTMPCTYVVGIAEDIKSQNLDSDPGYFYYLSIAQNTPDQGGLFVRTRGNAVELAESVRLRLQREMPGDAYVTVVPFDDVLGRVTRSWRVGANMFLAFGLLALVLAAIGLFSVISYNVAQRTHELGVRVALGAQRGDLTRLVVGEGMKLGVVGICSGAVIALVCGRWIAPLLFNESPRDPVVFGLVTGLLLMVILVASFIPAQRAGRVDPQVALRAE